MLQRDIKDAVFSLSTGQSAMINRLTKKKCKTQSSMRISITLMVLSPKKSAMCYFRGSLLLSKAFICVYFTQAFYNQRL